jgi:tetratricopeptide (TPR) repeat protein
VISVHDILGSPSFLAPRRNHKWLESLNSIFGQPLRGLALRNAGDVERTKGNLLESIKFFERAHEFFESSPDDPASWREAARTHERMGEALSDQGQVTKGLSHYEAAVKAWRQVVARDPGAATVDCTSLADSLVSAGELKYRMGEATLARTDLEEAIKIATILLVGRETLHDQCGAVARKAEPYLYLDGKALEVFSRAVLLRAQVLNFKEDYEGAPVLAMEARRLRLRSASASRNALVALAWGATVEFMISHNARWMITGRA